MTRAALPPFRNISDIIASYPAPAKTRFLQIRDVVFDCAEKLDVGPLEETLKWGEPAYLTPVTRAGSTLRIAWKASNPDEIGLYVNCQTTLVEQFRDQFANVFRFEGNRGVFLPCIGRLPTNEVASLVGSVLTYHRNKKSR